MIQSGGSGYRLSPRIEVRRGGEAGTSPANDPGAEGGVIIDDPGDTADDPGVNERQRWILEQLRVGVELRRVDLERQFRYSAKTAKRDLAELRDRGLTEFVPKPAPGHYRLVDVNQADLRAISAS